MESLKYGADTEFLLIGAAMVLAMHAGFAFLELGTVRKKNQVNALVKILVDFAVSTIAYFFIGYTIAYGVQFFDSAATLAQHNGYALVRFFFLLTFAAAIPAIVSGGIAERSKFNPQLFATFVLVGFIYPFFEGIAWNDRFGIQDWLTQTFGAPFHADVARFEKELLVTPQMHLSITAQHTSRTDHGRRVVKRIAVAFGVPDHQRDAQTRCERTPLPNRLAIHQGFGQRERFFTRLEYITRIA